MSYNFDIIPDGCASWLEYAWKHQHVNDGRTCWQCAAQAHAKTEFANAQVEWARETDRAITKALKELRDNVARAESALAEAREKNTELWRVWDLQEKRIAVLEAEIAKRDEAAEEYRKDTAR